MSEPMITVRDVVVAFGDHVLLEHLSFDVPERAVFVIMGASGCGKSTLLRHLIGLAEPRAGTIRIRGVDDPGALDRPPPFGVLFQSGALFGSMTVGENVALPLRRWTDLDAGAIEAIVNAKLALVGLSGFERHLPAEISGGMKRRAGIARALALDPPLLFLDEPGAGLDPITSVELDHLIRTLNESLGVTAVIVTHELESVFAVATECILLDAEARGIIAAGDPRVLRDQASDPRVARFLNRRPEEE